MARAESFDALGDRMKSYEMEQAGRRLMRGLPVMARLDGRSFHTFTRGLEKPYDKRFCQLMIETCKFLVGKEHALLGYVQSDEITLCWIPWDHTKEGPFASRVQKLESVLPSLAAAYFNTHLEDYLPEKVGLYPHFDCRVWNVPSLMEVYNTFLWRELDATKNSLTMLASAYYSNKELHGKHSGDKHDMLHAKGINWNDEWDSFKRGTYLQRQTISRILTPEELSKIPERFRPQGPIMRTSVETLPWPPLRQIRPADFNSMVLGSQNE